MKRASEILQTLTLEEKASLCQGATFWLTKEIAGKGIPEIMMTDGPHGLRKQTGETDHLGVNKSVPATCFPSAAALASRAGTQPAGVAKDTPFKQYTMSMAMTAGGNTRPR